ncbi:MAG: neutral zinc metallopeptidase, partial [Devosia sp.]
MKWQGRERSSNIEDRRSQGGGGFRRSGGGMGNMGGIRIPLGRSGGGLGLVGIIVVLGIIWFATGQNPIDVLTGGMSGGSTTSSSQWAPSTSANQDELSQFVG